MSEEYFQLLRNMAVFGGLTDTALQLILDESRIVHIAAGEYFFHEGDGADSLFVLQQGSVDIERLWHGKPIVLRTFRRGACLGEMAIIDLMPRSASVRAKEDCQALEIRLVALQKLYKQEPEQYAIIMMNMGREVSRRLRKADDRLLAFERREIQHNPTSADKCGAEGGQDV